MYFYDVTHDTFRISKLWIFQNIFCELSFTIGQILEDLISQPYQNLEVIVCNDESEDGTAEVVKGYIEKNTPKTKTTKRKTNKK